MTCLLQKDCLPHSQLGKVEIEVTGLDSALFHQARRRGLDGHSIHLLLPVRPTTRGFRRKTGGWREMGPKGHGISGRNSVQGRGWVLGEMEYGERWDPGERQGLEERWGGRKMR